MTSTPAMHPPRHALVRLMCSLGGRACPNPPPNLNPKPIPNLTLTLTLTLTRDMSMFPSASKFPEMGREIKPKSPKAPKSAYLCFEQVGGS